MSDHNIEDFTQYVIEKVDEFKISFSHKNQIESHDFKYGQWLPTDFSNPDRELVYAEKENDVVYFFPEFGSKIWHRLFPNDEKAHKVSVPKLFVILMSLAKVHQDEMMLNHCYQALLYGYFSGIETDKDGYPEDFLQWLKDETLLSVRSFLVEYNVLKTNNQETFFPQFSLNDEIQYSNPKSKAKLRFLMDKKLSLDALEKLWEKANKPEENVTPKINLIKDVLDETLKKLDYLFLDSRTDDDDISQKFTWLKMIDNKDYLFLSLTYEHGLQGIYAEQFLQHSLLRKWQEKEPQKDLSYYHFKRDLYNLFKDDEEEKFDKKFNNMGLWKYDVMKSEKVLTKNLSELLDLLQQKENALLHVVNENFPEKFFQKSAQDYVDLFENMMYAPYDLLFVSLNECLAVLIYKAAQKGDFKKATEIISIFESRLNDAHRAQNEVYKKEISPFFEAVKNHKKAILPQFRLI